MYMRSLGAQIIKHETPDLSTRMRKPYRSTSQRPDTIKPHFKGRPFPSVNWFPGSFMGPPKHEAPA
jgi:hypothetical protein